MKSYGIKAVINFAGLKAVGESVQNQLEYYDNNVGGIVSLLKTMTEIDIKRLFFSSVTVYSDPHYLAIDDAQPMGATSPYGCTKVQVKNILEDLSVSDASCRMNFLRYINPEIFIHQKLR